jgi:hypothetical protein
MTRDIDKRSGAPDEREAVLFDRVAEILDAARTHVSRTVNTTMVQAYWLIGREIVEVEQGGAARASYGDELVQRLASRMTARYGRGFTASSIKRMRQFYQAFPNGSRMPEVDSTSMDGAALRHYWGDRATGAPLRHQFVPSPVFPPQLSWTHYRKLLTVKDEGARAFYEIESAREGWTGITDDHE